MDNLRKFSTYLVEWIHKGGYSAPIYYVEVQNEYRESDTIREAVNKAKSMSRLADFSIWYCKLSDVTKTPSRKRRKKQ